MRGLATGSDKYRNSGRRSRILDAGMDALGRGGWCFVSTAEVGAERDGLLA